MTLQDIQGPNSASPLASALSSLSTWNHAIDPRLFSGDVSPASAHHSSPLMPHQTSTSSELANALTPRQPSTPGPLTVLPNQTATDYRHHYSLIQQQSSDLRVPPQPSASVATEKDEDDPNDNDEEQQVIASLEVTPLQPDQQMALSSSISDRQTSSETSPSDEVDGSARFCSVKGCKAVIPGKT